MRLWTICHKVAQGGFSGSLFIFTERTRGRRILLRNASLGPTRNVGNVASSINLMMRIKHKDRSRAEIRCSRPMNEHSFTVLPVLPFNADGACALVVSSRLAILEGL